MHTWFDDAAVDIFIADGGVDDFEDLTQDELEHTIRTVLLDYVPMILESAKKLQEVNHGIS